MKKTVPSNYIVVNPRWTEIMKASAMADEEIQKTIKQVTLWQTEDYSEANTEEGAPWIDSDIFGDTGVNVLQKMALNFIYSELVANGIITEVKA